MKVIYTRENMMNQEFQQCSESQLIEVMILKMHMIQFGSIVKSIQMKWMRVMHTCENMMSQ
jgi:glycerol-3-phosphate responsive antiterminator